METIYRADDGKEFYDEDECREYEERQKLTNSLSKIISMKTILTTKDFRRIPLEEFYGRWDDVFGIYFPDDESAEAVQNFLEERYEWSRTWPDFECGTFWWNRKDETWENLNKLRDEITMKITKIGSAE